MRDLLVPPFYFVNVSEHNCGVKKKEEKDKVSFESQFTITDNRALHKLFSISKKKILALLKENVAPFLQKYDHML